jgi:hypothetical protein
MEIRKEKEKKRSLGTAWAGEPNSAQLTPLHQPTCGSAFPLRSHWRVGPLVSRYWRALLGDGSLQVGPPSPGHLPRVNLASWANWSTSWDSLVRLVACPHAPFYRQRSPCMARMHAWLADHICWRAVAHEREREREGDVSLHVRERGPRAYWPLQYSPVD